jgi:integrase
MAHLIQRPDSNVWWGSFTGADGRRVRRSCGTSNRTEALTILLAWERTAKEARQGVLTEARVRRVLSDTLEQATGAPLPGGSVREYFHEWVGAKQKEKATRTGMKYAQVAEHFLSSLASRANLPLEAIVTSDVSKWRDLLIAEGRSGTTTNDSVKIVASVFEKAKRGGRIQVNPCHELGNLRDEAKGERDIFTPEQVRALVNATKGTDWEGATLVGFFTGLRLRDVTGLTWGAVDTTNHERWFLRVVPLKTLKTNRGVAVPVHPELRNWLESRPRGIGKAPVFPSLANKSGAGKSGLSMQFKRIMEKAGIVGKALRVGKGAGRSTSSLSFHSLRHSFTSTMTAAGVPEEVRMLLTGHSTKKAHKIYTHHEETQVWGAISALPGVL